MAEIPPQILAQLIQDFQQQKLARLAPRVQQAPAPLDPIATQGVTQSQIFARLLGNPVKLPGGRDEGINELSDAVMKAGVLNAQKDRENQRRLEASSIFKNNQPVDIDALKRAQGLNLRLG